jgi:hypothetical protein
MKPSALHGTAGGGSSTAEFGDPREKLLEIIVAGQPELTEIAPPGIAAIEAAG